MTADQPTAEPVGLAERVETIEVPTRRPASNPYARPEWVRAQGVEAATHWDARLWQDGTR